MRGIRFLRRLGLPMVGLIFLSLWSGCALPASSQYDERYRLFFATGDSIQADPSDSVDELASQFIPEIGVRRSIEEFTAEGFELAEIRPIEWGESATLFVFRRRLGSDEKPLRAPLSFTGTYRSINESGQTVDYVLVQGQDSYDVHIMTGGDLTSYRAEWEGRELVWWNEAGKNNARLTPDGMELYHLIENPTGFDLPRDRTMIRARRLILNQEPLSPEARDAQRYLSDLKPRTPRSYDPYPW